MQTTSLFLTLEKSMYVCAYIYMYMYMSNFDYGGSSIKATIFWKHLKEIIENDL